MNNNEELAALTGMLVNVTKNISALAEELDRKVATKIFKEFLETPTVSVKEANTKFLSKVVGEYFEKTEGPSNWYRYVIKLGDDSTSLFTYSFLILELGFFESNQLTPNLYLRERFLNFQKKGLINDEDILAQFGSKITKGRFNEAVKLFCNHQKTLFTREDF